MRLTNPVQVTSAVGVEDYPTWSPDGQRLAYHSNQSGNWDIWVTQLGGGDAVNFTADNEGEDQFPSWSPDGRQIAFLSRRKGSWGAYTVSALGGGARHWLPLGSELVRGRPQWSSDGTELAVAFEAGDQNVADILTLSSQNERRVTLPRPKGNVALDLSWSPDGETFAFVSANAPLAEITQVFVVPVSGGEAIPVTDGTTNAWHPNWSPDGSRLYFVSNRGGSMDLWEQPIGSDFRPDDKARAVTTGMGLRSALLSADASKLAYSLGRTVSNVWRVPLLRDRRATWADAEPITSDNVYTENVKVSLDGSLFISSDRSGNQDLWVRKRDENAFQQLTFDLALQAGPKVSPDGKEIVFYGFRGGSREVMVMPASGGPARALAPHPSEDVTPSWSPDGSRIVFASRRSGNRDIWLVDSTGGEATQLTTDVAEELAPYFSPDAKWVYFTSDWAGEFHIWRIPAEGGIAERVTQSVGFTARFSPDGRTLYFTEWPATAGNIWAKALDDGTEYPVTDLAGRPGELGWDMDTDNEYLYFTWFDETGDIWVMDVMQDESP
jgi:Tol biopolymer transport system component